MMIVLYTFTLLSGIISNVCKERTLKKIALFLMFSMLWIFLGWSSGAYDVEVAISRYENYEYYSSFTEFGYNALIVLAHKIGLSCRTFFVLCSFFDIFAIFYFVNRNSKSSIMTLLLFVIFPFVIYLQYVKNILAFSFILFAFDCLLNKRKHYVVKYFIFVLLACTIHLNSAFFILLLPLEHFSPKKIVIGSFISFVLLSNSFFINIFYYFVELLLGEQKVIQISTSVNVDGQLGRVFAVVFAWLEFWAMYYFFKKCCHLDVTDNFSMFFYKLNILAILFIPLTANFGIGFARFFDLLSIVNYCFYSNQIIRIKKKGKKQLAYVILFIFLFGLLFLYYRNEEYRNAVLIPFFNNNELLR